MEVQTQFKSKVKEVRPFWWTDEGLEALNRGGLVPRQADRMGLKETQLLLHSSAFSFLKKECSLKSSSGIRRGVYNHPKNKAYLCSGRPGRCLLLLLWVLLSVRYRVRHKH